MNKKVIGSIFMILGTSIGAGMLALPIVTADINFSFSLLLLFLSWLIMTVGAFSLLEVNTWLPVNTNMISMAENTLGPVGKFFTWLIYLLLLYSLICAYLSGLSDITRSLALNVHITLSTSASTFLVLIFFGLLVYRGIGSVDLCNRALMTAKLFAYGLLVYLISQHIPLALPVVGKKYWENNAFIVMLTSFGYAIIIPSLRSYLNDQKTILKRVVLIGGFIPLLIYALWIFIIQQIIPLVGEYSLMSIANSANMNSALMNSLSSQLQLPWIVTIVKFFISICALTSFLGVSICLTDFIADGLTLKKTGKSGIIVYAVTYLPPLIIVLFFPGIYLAALHYAGLLCFILLIILPLLMLTCGRYRGTRIIIKCNKNLI